jgi:hypothetical protein
MRDRGVAHRIAIIAAAAGLILVLYGVVAAGARADIDAPIVLTQIPFDVNEEERAPRAAGMLRSDYGEGGRIVVLEPDQSVRVLSVGFSSAADPDVSFDGQRIVFAGKKTPSDSWNIFEIGVDGSGLRQVTRDMGDCRSPAYLSSLYTIISTDPWYQIAFTSTGAGESNELGPVPSTNLYSSRLDGSQVRRLTFNLSSDMDPFLMQDGRLLYASWQRSTLLRGELGRIALMAVNSDGTDVSIFASHEGSRIKQMPCTTTSGLAVFVGTDSNTWDGAGYLASVRLRRPMHSYERITSAEDGLFSWPSPLPDGGILVSHRPAGRAGRNSVYRLYPTTGAREAVFDDRAFHNIQAKVVRERQEPDGRSSVVTEEDPHGELYGLNVTITDLRNPSWMADGTVARLRVIEGIAHRLVNDSSAQPENLSATGRLPATNPDNCPSGIPPLVRKRILGDIPVQPDGSFYIKIPADIPIQLQALDDEGMALRTCSWIWAKNHEPRGCIGCHEDPELTPENRLVDAMRQPAIELTLAPERRRTVEFNRDIMPIIEAKCSVPGCHDGPARLLDLSSGPAPASESWAPGCFNRAYASLLEGFDADATPYAGNKRVHPGQARTSPLIWALYGRNTSRPWDATTLSIGIERMPPVGHAPLTPEEIQAFVEWIDLGALWTSVPDPAIHSEPGAGR